MAVLGIVAYLAAAGGNVGKLGSIANVGSCDIVGIWVV